MKKLTEIQKELARTIRPILKDRDAYIGTMLMLIDNPTNADDNCRKLLEYVRDNPDAGYDEVMEKADEIMGIEWPFDEPDD